MADWKKVTIRIVPNRSVHSSGQGAFILIERRDRNWVAWVDTRATSVIFEGDDHIKLYKRTVDDLSAVALTEEESRAFIARLASEFGGPREEPDDGRRGDLA